MKNTKIAFTLAEVLIVLGIIGVVAALTIPTLISNIGAKVKANRIKTINAKLLQGTDKLMILGQINGYQTTEDFVKALSEHYKISSWCKGDKIAECWPYDKIKVDTDDGEDFVEIKDLTAPESFGLDSENYGEPISFVTADGVPYIIMYNKKCNIDDEFGSNNRPISTSCIAGIYDYNGSRNPNKFVSEKDSETNMTAVDLQFMGGVSKLGKYDAIQVDGELNPPINGYKTFKVYDGEPLSGYEATEYCASLNMDLPDLDTMQKIVAQAYGRYPYSSNQRNQILQDKLVEGAYWTTGNAIEVPDGSDTYIPSYVKDSSIHVICVGK